MYIRQKLCVIFLILFFVSTASFGLEIKPGITITKGNYEKYLPELEKLLSPAIYVQVIDALKRGVTTLPIVERKKYPQPNPFYDVTMKYKGTCKIGPNNELLGWIAGTPFPNPKTALELAWNLDRKWVAIDQSSQKTDLLLYSKGVLEKKLQWYWNAYYYTGRTALPPLGEVPGNDGIIHFKENMVMLSPNDIKGFSMLRIRYEDVSKYDDVYAYIPAIRRVRRLTGKDVTDPMLGSDIIYDDFEGFRQKITPAMTFKMRELELLVPAYIDEKASPLTKTNLDLVSKNVNFPQVEWEIRPVYELEMSVNDPEYAYSKRVVIVDKERHIGASFYSVAGYDQRGRLAKSSVAFNQLAPPHYETWWKYVNWMNPETLHNTFWDWRERKNPDPEVKSENLSFKWILRIAR